jgi:hypothetical protein
MDFCEKRDFQNRKKVAREIRRLALSKSLLVMKSSQRKSKSVVALLISVRRFSSDDWS